MLLLKFGVLLLLACVAKAEEKHYPPEVTQDKPDEFKDQKGCYIPDLNTVIKRNKNYYPEGQCAKYACYDETFEAIRYTCDELEEKDGCTIEKGAELGPAGVRYPECCDTQNCD